MLLFLYLSRRYSSLPQQLLGGADLAWMLQIRSVSLGERREGAEKKKEARSSTAGVLSSKKCAAVEKWGTMNATVLKSVIAASCIAALLLSFSACKTKQGIGETTTRTGTSQSTTVTEASTVPGTQAVESTAAPSTTGKESTQAPGIQKPSNIAEAVALYNRAIKQSVIKSGTYSRKLDSGKALGFDLLELGAAQEFDQENQKLTNAKLSALSAGNVNSVKITETGTAYELNFELKEFRGTASSLVGAGGYMYFIDFTETKALVSSITKKLSNGLLKIQISEQGASLIMSGGEFSVTVSKTTGRLTRARTAFSEVVRVQIEKALLFPKGGSAEVVGHGAAAYTFQ